MRDNDCSAELWTLCINMEKHDMTLLCVYQSGCFSYCCHALSCPSVLHARFHLLIFYLYSVTLYSGSYCLHFPVTSDYNCTILLLIFPLHWPTCLMQSNDPKNWAEIEACRQKKNPPILNKEPCVFSFFAKMKILGAFHSPHHYNPAK